MPRTKQFEKQEVLDKAMKLFWEKGFHATSMEDLVSTLGINRASMYSTFGSKKGLFYQALDKYNTQNTQRVANFLYYQLNVRKGLHLLFQNLIDEATLKGKSKGCFLVNTVTEMAHSDEEIDQRIAANRTEFETVFYNYLKYGVDHGQISPYKDLHAISSYMVTLQNGLQVMSKTGANKEEMGKVVSTGLAVLD